MSDPVLVTGGAGFIGSHVAECLVEDGRKVVVIDDLSGGYRDNVPDGVDFVEADVADQEAIEAIFERRGPFEVVYHLAAYAAEVLSHYIRRFNYRNNVLGSMNVLNAAVRGGTRRLVFTSSIAAYGDLEPPMCEDMCPEPADPYGIAKLAVEQDLAAASELFDIEHTVFRPHNVYGERQNIADRYRNVVCIFINQLMRGEPMTIFGDGEQRRAFTHVDDVAPVIARSAFRDEAAGEIYNIGADRPVTINRLATVIADAMEVEPEVRHLEAREEVRHAWPSHEKIERELGYEARISLEEGIERTVTWATEHGAREPESFGELEIEQRLPEAWK